MNTHDLPLVIFTLSQQFAIGTFLLIGLLFLKQYVTGIDELKISRRFFWIVAVMVIGLLASTFHLGQPFRATNALHRLGSAWLSNEVFITGLLIASGGIFYLLAQYKPHLLSQRRIFLIITMLLGLGLLIAMSKLYMIETVPSWNNNYTPLSFIASTLLGGVLLCHLIINNTQHNAYTRTVLNGIGILALVFTLVITLLQSTYLAGISSSITTPIDQINGYYTYLYLRVFLALLAFIIWTVMILKNKYHQYSILIILIMIIIAEGLGRSMFYASHMTVGLL